MVTRRVTRRLLRTGNIVWLTLVLFAPLLCPAQTNEAAPEEAATVPLAPVTLDGETLFMVRGVSAFPAEKRAAVIADRIRAAAMDPAYVTGSIKVVEGDGFTTIEARGRMLTILADAEFIRHQVTHLRTPKNEEVIIPNSTILDGSVINYSSLAKKDSLILHTTVGIGYETPWRQVEAMQRLAAERTPGLLREPPPFVLHNKLGDFCITYELNVYCDRPGEQLQLYTALHRNILDTLNEHSVQIMTPAYETDPAEPKVVPKGRWFESPAKPQLPPEG